MKYIITIFIVGFFFLSCKKENFITSADARLRTSVDSLKFDTIFTTTGSITKSFKIFNTNEQKLLLSKIKLGGGTTSAFKMNVNGIAANELNNIEIAANDSIYVFVTVTINPTAASLPFIISDSILIHFNGNNAKINLEAFGQNANFIRNGIIISNVNFTNTLPYIILGSLQVASIGQLTINAGTKIYCHANAPIIIDGTLICNGSKAQPIIFSGDRLDEPYNGFPAAWPGIYFNSLSKDNVMQFAQVKNAYQAIVVTAPTTNANPKLILKQCIIDNAYDAGLLFSDTKILVENCLVSNCGRAVEVSYGGSYTFLHCTIASYSNNYVLHKNSGILLTDANSNSQTKPLNTLLQNCIVYGDAGFVQNEIQTSKVGSSFVVNIDHCLYRAVADPTNVTINASLKNIDPLFDSIDNSRRFYDFRITKNATAPNLNKGVATFLLKDLDDNNRSVGLPDIGAYEKQ
ncbi:MAG: hypothetical protein ABL929_10295 [Ferruginibacter sp.]|nr:hypothetical protein [Ferruginibacter sp.]